LSGLTLLTSLAHAVKPDGAIAPIHRAANPITDAQGRIETIVDFDFDPKSDIEFDHGVSPENERKWDKHQGKVINLLDHYEKKYGFTRSGMTSWAKVSATAFLAVDQIEKLSKDKRVLLLTENTRIDLSAPPPWGNAYVGSEYRSWGFSATNGKVGYSSASGRTVYIIDSGVALHTDLPGVVSRVNMACGNSLTNCSNGSTTDAYPVVGCYPHATHVAGIIGAKGGNGLTSAGVYDAARMVSVAVGSATGTNVGKCNTGITTGAVGYAIDFVYRQVLGAPPSYLNNGVAIANISINSGSFGYASNGTAETNRAALLRLATPDPNLYSYSPSTGWKSTPYPGAFIAQSAETSLTMETTMIPPMAMREKISAASTKLRRVYRNRPSRIRTRFRITIQRTQRMGLWLWALFTMTGRQLISTTDQARRCPSAACTTQLDCVRALTIRQTTVRALTFGHLET
jgi:hypothetical protein